MKYYPIKNQLMHFYLFKKSCADVFDELLEMLQPDHQQRFAIWEPKNKAKDHNLIVVYGMPLADSYCYQRNIWKTDEDVFISFYKYKMKHFEIYSYKETAQLPSKIKDKAVGSSFSWQSLLTRRISSLI